MKSRIAFLFLMFITLGQVACSKQWRENNVALTSQEVFAQLDLVSAMDVGGGYQDFVNLAYDPYTTVYFADSVVMGPSPALVASILDFSFMLNPFYLGEVQTIKVFFLDYRDGDYRDNALLVSAELQGGSSTDIFWGQGTVNDGQFVVDMVSDDGAAGITLKSYDVSKSGDLNGTIQLKTYLYPDSYIGKFSTLVGYK